MSNTDLTVIGGTVQSRAVLCFREFYEDVLPEFEQYGQVVQFKVCCNCEPHLRGNVYVEYASERDAVAAFQKFQGRWYGGRQLNVEFTCVSSWKSALCGELNWYIWQILVTC